MVILWGVCFVLAKSCIFANSKKTPMSVISFKLKEEQEFIELIKLLKATNVAESGAMAQELVINAQVKRNGETELRKRAKIRRNELITIGDYEIRTY